MASSFLKKLPNILTGSRLFFTAGFLALLYLADHNRLNPADVVKLNWSFILFVTAGITDILDGPLARRLEVTSKFGRTFDPFVDKVLSGGGFILIALKGAQDTGLYWWMVAIILAREVFVTVIRQMSELHGKEFGATWAGKLKMFLQCFTIGTIIMYLGHFQHEPWAYTLRDICIWVTVIFTALSAVIYLPRMKHIGRKGKES